MTRRFLKYSVNTILYNKSQDYIKKYYSTISSIEKLEIIDFKISFMTVIYN